MTLDIACFRYDPGGMDAAALAALNAEITMRLQERGIVAFSDTTVRGGHWLRVAIRNRRMTNEDIGMAVKAGAATGDTPTHAPPA